jgi:hypothetical protein
MANVGSPDRMVRGAAGVVLMALPFVTSFNMWSNPMFSWGIPLVGLVLLLTAVFSFCPAYRLLGMNTCGLKR